ncbi:MAG: hypothetical protein M1821_003535 [Bathelium mastoideum]|nr:MAG: hypothetical protein M1821_003535 [Bathelium mastoideum]KAI9682622.1 MAG: hypothetical protein M1822_006920 [Bathelium mastoideum]
MSSTSPVILILGSGPNVGQNVAQAFAAKGYKVALASRKLKEEESTAEQVNISSDLSDPKSVIEVFSKVKASLGLPSVVVYNGKSVSRYSKPLLRNLANILKAGAATQNEEKNPLSLPLGDFTRDLNINTVSAFVAAQQAALSFEQLPDSASKAFIYTGNILNTTTLPPLMDLGVGKSATAHFIQSAAKAYADRGFKYVFVTPIALTMKLIKDRFYYADERKADGSAAYFDIDGEAHATHYVQLAEGKSQGPWQQTFVKGLGYKHFAAT